MWYIGDRVETTEGGLTYMTAPQGFTRQIGLGPKVIFELPSPRAGAGQPLAETLFGPLGTNKLPLARDAGLGEPLVSDHLHSAILEILTMHGNPKGTTGWNVLQGPRLQVWMAGQLIAQKLVTPQDPEWTLQLQRVRQVIDDNAANEQVARMILYQKMRQFGVDPETQDPTPFHPTLTPLRPATLRTETFAGDGDPVGAVFSWTEYDDVDRVSDVAVVPGTSASNGHCRCDTGPGGADMYTEIDVATHAGVTHGGPACRYNASAETFAVFLVRSETSNTYRFYKVTAGSFTQVGSSVNTTPPSAPYEAKLSISSSDAWTGLIDDSGVIGPETDSHESSSSLWGMACGRGGATAYMEFSEGRCDVISAPAGFAHTSAYIIG